MWTRTLQVKRSLFGILTMIGLTLPAQLLGQVDTGSISGTLRDTTGAIIANANLTLVNQDTGVTISITSGAAGEYTFSPLKIGHYSLSAEMAGFERVRQENITVEVQEKAQVDVTLPPPPVERKKQ